jgi:hypothetical protein
MLLPKSSDIYSAEWIEHDLFIVYKTGDVYKYIGVPEDIYAGLIHAESAGKYLNTWVKQVGYKYIKLGKVIWKKEGE